MAAAGPPSFALDRGDFTHWGDGRRTISRDDFWALADRYVRIIQAEPRVGAFALIVAPTSLDMMALFVALIAAGRTASFFPPGSTRQDAEAHAEQQVQAVRRIKPSSVLLMQGQEGVLGGLDLGGERLVLPRLSELPDAAADGARARTLFAQALERTDPLFWQHSSGTTGIKKAVGVSGVALARQHLSYWPAVAEAVGGGPVRVASWLPLYHDMGLMAGFLLPLLGGASLAVMDPFDWVDAPQRFLEMIEAQAASVCWMPNFAFRHYTRLRRAMPRRDLGAMRAWISCSEPCRYADAVAFEESYGVDGVGQGSVLGCYAMAETVFAVSQLGAGGQRALVVGRDLKPGDRVGGADSFETTSRHPQVGAQMQAVLSSGAPIADVRARVFLRGRPVDEEGVYGEIGLASDFLFPGYRGLAPAQSNIRPDGFYLTGDLGVILEGALYVFGRTKEIVIVNGKNLHVGDVEDRIGAVPGVRPGRAVAFGLDSPALGTEALVVVAERDAACELTDADIRAGIVNAISDAFLVKPYDVRLTRERWLVKTTSGKLSRAKNKAKYLRDFRSDPA